MGESIVKSKFLQTCEISPDLFKVEPFSMVIFGGAGDLSKRKLIPAIFHLFIEGELEEGFSVVGFGQPELSDEQYRKVIREALREFAKDFYEEKKQEEFSKHFFYVSGAFDIRDNYRALCERLEKVTPKTKKGTQEIIYYMAVPPNFMPVIVLELKKMGLCKEKFKAKIIVEKPFGRDKQTAKELNNLLNNAFNENQIYRIDHYLAKNTVQDIIFFRFSNSIFEPLWNRRYIDHVQITVAEDIGIEHRGKFYEQAGVVRDIVQNHIMQLIALVAMEPPVGFEADLIRDEKVKIFRSIRIMDDEMCAGCTVRGQYGKGEVNSKEAVGYRQEKNVAADSKTPTFMAAKMVIDNWRWAGVPFYVRTGKRLSKRLTQIVVQFKQPPLKLFGRTCDEFKPNILVLSVQPQEKISLRFGVRNPNSNKEIYPVNMDFNYRDTFKTKDRSAYERLLIDSMKGDLTLFVRQDGVEAMWSVVDPIIANWEHHPADKFPNYCAGSWGPEESDKLLERDGRKWINAQDSELLLEGLR